MDIDSMREIAVLIFKRVGALSCSCGHEINVIALEKPGEVFAFLYDDESRAETLRVLGRFASNPDLSFTWYDTAVSSQKIRQKKKKQDEEARSSLGRRFDLPFPEDC